MPKITFTPPIYSFHIDFMGHVNNNVYIQWMEIGRHKIMDAIGMPVNEIAETGFVPILAKTEISYLTPLFMGDRVRIEMWLSELRRASALIEFRFFNQDEILAASGSQKGLFIDTVSQRPMRLNSEMRALFEKYLIENKE